VRAHPVSKGRLCLKGWHAHEIVDNPARLARPLVRRGEALEETSWEEALAYAAQGLQAVLQSAGPQAVGVLGSARCANEDNYLLVRLARSVLGTPNVDCSLAAYSLPEYVSDATSYAADGADGRRPSGQLADLDDSDLILMVGADPGEEHPGAGARVYRALQRGAKLVTASVRKHALARLAHVHLPLRPGAEMAWLGSLIHVLLVERRMAGAKAEKVAALVAGVADLNPAATQSRTGLPAAALQQTADLYQAAGKVTVLFSSALACSPEGARAVRALASLGWLGRLGIGPEVVLLDLLSRSNLRGCWDMGVRPGFLPGNCSVEDSQALQRLQEAWGGPFASGRGLPVWRMIGETQALYVMGDDPSRTLPEWPNKQAALGKLKFLVVQDMFLSPLAALAHVVLPAASFAERQGTWTNLEGRLQLARPAVAPMGEAREDWRILVDLSRAMGKPMPYQSAEDVFAEITRVIPAYGGLSYQALGVSGGARVVGPAHHEETDEELVAVLASSPPPSETSEQFPLVLAADPSLGPWDDEVTTSAMLSAGGEFTVVSRENPNGMLCLNPADARRYNLRRGATVQVTSAKGAERMQVRTSEEVPEGVAVTPYHHATRLGIMDIATEADTGRPMIAATPVSVELVQSGGPTGPPPRSDGAEG
jgi:predicted molibdopterin-dependent oxidoreductase YjgC